MYVDLSLVVVMNALCHLLSVLLLLRMDILLLLNLLVLKLPGEVGWIILSG